MGIERPLFIVVPSMFIAATPVGAGSNTIGLSGLIGAYLKVFIAVWYIVLIKWLLPQPPLPLIKG